MDPTPEPHESLPSHPFCAWLGVVALISMPLVKLSRTGLAIDFLPKQALNLTLFDPLIWLAALALVIDCVARRGWQGLVHDLLRTWLPCVWPGLLLLAVALASVCHLGHADRKTWMLVGKNCVQWCEYLLVTPLVALPLLADRTWRWRLFWGLCLTIVATVAAVAWWTPLSKVFAGEIHAYRVGGLLGNRHTYGLFMAVSLCLIAGWAHAETTHTRSANPVRTQWLLIPAAVLPLVALYPCLAAGPLVGLLVGLGITFAATRRAGVLMPFVLLLFLLLVDGEKQRPLRLRELGRSVQTFRVHRAQGEIMARSRPSMRCYRWSANIALITDNPFLGVGWGQYQRHIGRYYRDLPYPEGRTDEEALYDLEANEPFTFSWYFVSAAECGLIGLTAILAFLAVLIGRCLGQLRGAPCCNAAGVLGAVVALLVAGLWTSPMVRGCGPLLGVLLAMSWTRPDSLRDADRGQPGRPPEFRDRDLERSDHA